MADGIVTEVLGDDLRAAFISARSWANAQAADPTDGKAPNVRMGQRQNLGAIELVLVDADSAFEGDLSGLGRSRIFSFNQFLD